MHVCTYTAFPTYHNATAITQYVYSDSDSIEIECPLQLGRLHAIISPYYFAWQEASGILLNNGNQGLSWFAEENNGTLHVGLSATVYHSVQCFGRILRCIVPGSSSCNVSNPLSPAISLRIVGKTEEVPLNTLAVNFSVLTSKKSCTYSEVHSHQLLVW